MIQIFNFRQMVIQKENLSISLLIYPTELDFILYRKIKFDTKILFLIESMHIRIYTSGFKRKKNDDCLNNIIIIIRLKVPKVIST